MMYYAGKDQQANPHGPIAESDFYRLIEEGSVTPEHICWKEGLPQWLPVSEFIQLFPAPAPLPRPASISKSIAKPDYLDVQALQKKSELQEKWISESEAIKSARNAHVTIPQRLNSPTSTQPRRLEPPAPAPVAQPEASAPATPGPESASAFSPQPQPSPAPPSTAGEVSQLSAPQPVVPSTPEPATPPRIIPAQTDAAPREAELPAAVPVPTPSLASIPVPSPSTPPASTPAAHPVIPPSVLPQPAPQVAQTPAIQPDVPPSTGTHEIPTVFAAGDNSAILMGRKSADKDFNLEDYDKFDEESDEDNSPPGGLGRFAFLVFQFIILPLLVSASMLFALVPGLARKKVFTMKEASQLMNGIQFDQAPWDMLSSLDSETVVLAGCGGILFAALISFITILSRFKNACVSRFWFFGLFIPILNIYPSWLLLCAPPKFGRKSTRMDFWGWFLTAVFLLSFIASIMVNLNSIQHASDQAAKFTEGTSQWIQKIKSKSANPPKPEPGKNPQPAPPTPSSPAPGGTSPSSQFPPSSQLPNPSRPDQHLPATGLPLN